MPSGFVDRYKGKGYQPSGWLQQVGAGGAVTPGGGQINSTSAASTSGGIQLSTIANVEATLLSYTVPAKTLDRLGRNLLVTAFGTFSTFNGGLKTARLYYGSQVVAIANGGTSTTAAPSATVPWWLQMNIFAQTAFSTSAGVQAILTQNILSTVHGGCGLLTGSEITGLNSTIKVTGISSSPTAASPGDVTAYSLQVEGLN
jgi:hypothetical protein